ncbi:Thaumatin family [Legionella beliardensis]|uniref:Thaumatin family n=1 Tax=Legionella beliardensis TaxID=91822 RepID=A0A378ICZ9_9GAMM|nr:hypothetical protein [Legionella beliardensis]STX30174.1 Thaumatin family [Legionella beliardensis]
MTIKKILLLGLIFFTKAAFAGVVPPTSEQTSRLRITNQCNNPIWIQQDYIHTTQDPIVVQIPQGQAYDYTIPDIGLAATRFWPKVNCNQYGYDCRLGESTAVPDAIARGIQHGPFAPDINSKFEATWGCLQAIFDKNPNLCATNPSAPSTHLNTETWWNGSAVDGYTLPYNIVVKKDESSCKDIVTGQVITNPGVNCSKLSVDFCPRDENLSTNGRFNTINGIDVTHVNLQWVDRVTQAPIGCFSPCAKMTTAQGSENGNRAGGWSDILGGLTPPSPQAQMYCCPTPPVSSEACSAGVAPNSAYSISVHTKQQCDAYTYAYDDAKGLARCGAQTQFEVVFCPNSNPTVPSVSMTMFIPTGVSLQVDGKLVSNNQVVLIKNGSTISLTGTPNSFCNVNVNTQQQASGASGDLCSKLAFDNTAKSIRYLGDKPSTSYILGIPRGMSVTINNQVIRWDSPNKTVQLAQGVTTIEITGTTKIIRRCPVTLKGESLTWPAIKDCQGLVNSGGVLYFPAF